MSIAANQSHFFDHLLRQEKVLLVHGKAFNLAGGCHFRLVFSPHVDILEPAIKKLQTSLNITDRQIS
ncbi:MAG: alanine-synthesizing transaminase [Paraglaciecola sp.]|jgi:alanine-synthesizing transaminase